MSELKKGLNEEQIFEALHQLIKKGMMNGNSMEIAYDCNDLHKEELKHWLGLLRTAVDEDMVEQTIQMIMNKTGIKSL